VRTSDAVELSNSLDYSQIRLTGELSATRTYAKYSPLAFSLDHTLAVCGLWTPRIATILRELSSADLNRKVTRLRIVLCRASTVALICLVVVAPVFAANPVTIAQLEQFLASKQAAKESDDDVSDRLNDATLSEELGGSALERILGETRSRPKTAAQIELLAAESIFEPAPSTEQPHDPAPDSEEQRRIIEAARTYVNGALQLLPDFLAVRVTRSFDNTFTDEKPKHGKPKARMHFVAERRREMAYRNGHEASLESRPDGASTVGQLSGMSTWGEFGGILKIVLKDAFNGSVAWERWQRSEAGERIAVFRYAIPESASHYSIDFCCYLLSKENPVELPFKAKPGYRGEIFVDPRDGSIERITVEAELKESDPVRRSAIAVQYAEVAIGGRRFKCPIRGVAVTETRNLLRESIDGVGLEKHTNLVRFESYRKFGSTSRILPTP
jgi:hypothetical protein